INGKPLTQWACPNHPDIPKYTNDLISDILSRYDITGIFIDRFRFPSFYDGIEGSFTCFCENCKKNAENLGLNLEEIQDDVKKLFDCIVTGDLEKFKTLTTDKSENTENTVSFQKLPGIIKWQKFRRSSVTGFVSGIYRHLKENFPDKKMGLDIWTPVFAGLVGQDYRALKDYCDWIKPILYPINYGPASLSGEIVFFIEKAAEFNPALNKDMLLKVFYNLFGFKFELTEDFNTFKSIGFPLGIYGTEYRAAKEMMGEEMEVNMGCPLIEAVPDEIEKRVKAVAQLGAQGVSYYCFEYATEQNLIAAGKAWKKYYNN
ncbi:MAG: hypothetical protein ABIA63_02570, partial [bacterium]